MENIARAIYINLEKRKDRKEHMETQLREYGLDNFERFDAIECKEMGCIGCAQSFLAVLELARDRQYRNVLIFEDDFQFTVPKDQVHEQINDIFAQKFDWDVMMLAYHPVKAGDEISGYTRLLDAQAGSAFIVQQHYFDKLIATWKDALSKLISTRAHWLYASDASWKSLQMVDQWYGVTRKLGKQMASYSDNALSYVEYDC
jgi:glycosyl transferase family 25